MFSGQKIEGDPHNTEYNQLPAYDQQQSAGFTSGFPTTNPSSNVITSAPTPIVVVAPPRGNDWLVPAIFSCLCCFWPTGICAIIAAVNARSLFDVGDYDGGRSSAGVAKWLTLTSLGIGLICVVILIALFIVKRMEDVNDWTTTTTTTPWY
ncbi:transmembrane protein 233-like isoform X2 [Saccostrea cucullata]|uniref:transmembrane protein 233-like isoform X2 n=1 Tax=Saccostrea cuccullata TaxID=36930 RepID=UPI002ED500BF